MKSIIKYVLIVVFSISLFYFNSCQKATENVAISNALVGIWRTNNATTEVTVGGEDFIEYATSNFDLNENEAMDIQDNILASISWKLSGTIVFSGEKTYQYTPNNSAEEQGIWSVSVDGQTLRLFYQNEPEDLTIVKIAATTLTVQLQTTKQSVDLNGDGEDETIVDINIKSNLTKPVGGAGG